MRRGFRRTSVNLNQAVLSTIHLVKSRLSNRIKLVTRLEDIPTIFGHLSELKQVVLNLLINAIDALEENQKVNPDGRIFISTGHNTTNNHVVLTISDNGTGVDKTNLHQIFEPFFTTKQVGSGSGLGLYVCHQIINAHQGQIDVESLAGDGATFIITVPADLRREPR